MGYTIVERIEIIFLYGSEKYCVLRTANVFSELLLRLKQDMDKNATAVYVRLLVQKFGATGSVRSIKAKKPRLLYGGALIEILGQVAMCSTTSLRIVTKLTGESLESVRKIFHSNKFYFLQIAYCPKIR